MARLEAQAVAGYYPTPQHLVPMIAAELRVGDGRDKDRRHFSALDPCAGDGHALISLVTALGAKRGQVHLYAIEMEPTRGELMSKEVSLWSHDGALVGDAFRAAWTRSQGVSLLYLNPPYDHDPEFGRLEEKFLRRFGPTLEDGGVLVLVVPAHALPAHAETLARDYDRISVRRFPVPDYAAYKQVVVIARRRAIPLPVPDPREAQVLRDQGAGERQIEVLGAPSHEVASNEIPASTYNRIALYAWRLQEVDLPALLAAQRPWHRTSRAGALEPVASCWPDAAPSLLERKYPMAVPPRPAHIAAGIASGVFNGQRLEAEGKPALLVKGVFDREFRTIEERHNKDGEVVGEVQVQQPKLVVTALDLATKTYRELSSTPGAVEELLADYGPSMMTAMRRQCPVLYDPRTDAGQIVLAPSARKPFTAQAHAARAIVKLLHSGVQVPVLLGEIGSGKSSVSLVAALTYLESKPQAWSRARRILVACPPHLLDGWRNEVRQVDPSAEVVVLRDVADVQALVDRPAPGDGLVVALLSREAAKLGHAWAGVGGDACPRCGTRLGPVDASSASDRARVRARCGGRARTPANGPALVARELAVLLEPHVPNDGHVSHLLSGRMARRRQAHYAAGHGGGKWNGLPLDLALRIVDAVVGCKERRATHDLSKAATNALMLAALAVTAKHRPVVIQHAARIAHAAGMGAQSLLLMLEPGKQLQAMLLEELRASKVDTGYGWSSNSLDRFDDVVRRIASGGDEYTTLGSLKWSDGPVIRAGDEVREQGSLAVAIDLLSHVGLLGRVVLDEECREPLYQATPEPTRRLPLATHISRRHKRLFDFLIVDEVHESGNADAAQSKAYHRLIGMGLPTIAMTGSIMNGYASSLFANWWSFSPEFRTEFDRSEMTKFVDRYGYRKVVVEDRDKDGKLVEFGSHSDRVERKERPAGDAPGILPLFLLRHLLPRSVTLHKADLAIDLPACTMEVERVEPSPAQATSYEKLKRALLSAIKRDRFDEKLSGKLFGQLAELPSCLDRATSDVGNAPDGSFEVRYPASVGASLVERAEGLAPTTLLPKEAWMLERLGREVAEGRNVMIFTWHLQLIPRLKRLVEQAFTFKVPVLLASKVPTGKRQAWIDEHVVRPGARVMIANPVCIQTGLNNLVHFATELWMENPACNPTVFRQAVGRVDRVGQRLPTRIVAAIYRDTAQVQMQDLMMHKVSTAIAADGLDPESALEAAGIVEDDYLAGLSLGKQLYAMMKEDD